MVKYVRADPDTLRTWVIQFGIVPLVVAVGIALMGLINFWIGLALLTVGAGAYAYDLWQIKKQRIGAAIVILGYGALIWIAFVPAPLDMIADQPQGTYAKGTRILGLEWSENELPITVTLLNDTETAFENFDSYFRTDKEFIARVGLGSGINRCEATPENRGMTIAQPSISTGNITIPLWGADHQTMQSTIYRVRCDKIAAHSRIEIVLAINAPDKAKWIIASFRYDAANRRRGPYFVPRCLIKTCAELPNNFAGG